jgi:hypothetical protein
MKRSPKAFHLQRVHESEIIAGWVVACLSTCLLWRETLALFLNPDIFPIFCALYCGLEISDSNSAFDGDSF